MRPLLRGAIIGAWGAVIHLLVVGLFTDPWLVWAHCAVWALVYWRKPVTLPLAALQAATTVVVVVAGTILREPSWYALMSAAPALLYFGLWMMPAGLFLSFVRGGRRSQLSDASK